MIRGYFAVLVCGAKPRANTDRHGRGRTQKNTDLQKYMTKAGTQASPILCTKENQRLSVFIRG